MSVVSDPIEDPRRALRAARLGEFRVFVRRFLRNPLGVVGFAIVVLLVLVAIFAPLLATHDPYLPSLGKRLSAPSAEFWFGADELGRDIYSRLVYGSRLTLFIVGLVIVTSAPIGLIIGAVSGTVGGWTDRIFMRITDVFLAVPKLLLALAFVAALGPGIVNAALAITLTAWPPYARLARAEAMVVRNSDYVAAARLAGASPFRIIVFHVIPMCLSSVIVRVTFDMAGIILTAAGLGFIGLGAQPPLPEWGAMISTGRRFIFDQWWVPTIPGIAIFVVSLGFNLLGDAVRDLLDPHLRQRR
ncbi:MAG: D-ala-D-ala transporter subunit [Devosia sp. 67-54]|uniref:ABC transporter permease n=1 Tax=unclassified Devosia TaxID=196773 RepID=UPI000968096A|nr:MULTISPECIES: ABC transporter permease [unclassified Devosia]MBN9305240.1 ABC transporter permease [Devosia sp.]OJX14845.1 MAG: D-ala-D-ala transporter subunit [Devosia sp. 67-54]